MPAKNAEKYVRLAVLSTLFSLPRSSELIVINDGSTDQTMAQLSTIHDSRLRILENPEKGLVRALNFGIKSSKGHFIARMDADDICMPWRFPLQLQRMKRRSDMSFLFSTAIAFGKPLLPLGVMPQLPWSLDSTDFMRVLTRRNPGVHPTMIARASAIRSIGGYVECPAEDEYLWLRASLTNLKLARHWVPVLALRLHPTQTTRQKEWRDALSSDSRIPELRRQLSVATGSLGFRETPIFKALDYLDAQGLRSLRNFGTAVKSLVSRRRNRESS